MIPGRCPNGQRGRGETATIYIGGYEVVRSREVASRNTGDLARGRINAQLSIVPCVELAAVWAGRPIGKDFFAGGLKIELAFSSETEDAFPVNFIYDSNCTISTAYTLMGCDSGDLYRDRSGAVETSSIVTCKGSNLSRRSDKHIAQSLPEGAAVYRRHCKGWRKRFAVCHSDAGFGSRARYILSEWMAVRSVGG